MLLLLQATQAADSVQVAADELMKEAIANGKHILVEKSITLNSDELDEANCNAGGCACWSLLLESKYSSWMYEIPIGAHDAAEIGSSLCDYLLRLAERDRLREFKSQGIFPRAGGIGRSGEVVNE